MPAEQFRQGEQLFEWDTRKNLSNIEKHGIPFKEAATVFMQTLSKMKEIMAMKNVLWLSDSARIHDC
ncbi:MAG: BrnT family toxin [Oscillospiraceae bacterium]|nr:BrnT family toxin [Oscillospiraceae bacterium]